MATREKSEYLPEFTALDATKQAAFSKKLNKKKKEAEVEDKGRWDSPGVVYLGHIPHGFYEEQMWQYFGQFGRVLRLKLSRSKKTGRSKGYAFIEFKSEAVAKVVADTMNNYLMFKRLLKCQFLPMESVHPNTFWGSDRPFTEPTASKIAAKRHNAPQTVDQKSRAEERRGKRIKDSIKKLAEQGIEYDISSLVKMLPNKVKSRETRKARKETAEALSGAELAEKEKEAFLVLNNQTVSDDDDDDDDEGVGDETLSVSSDDEIQFGKIAEPAKQTNEGKKAAHVKRLQINKPSNKQKTLKAKNQAKRKAKTPK